MDKVAHRVVMQPLGDYGIGHAVLDVLIHGQIQIGEQLDLSDQDQVVILRKVLRSKKDRHYKVDADRLLW